MLQKETVEPRTLELLRELQREPLLKNFNLVGGTALALRLGHRKSIDLDLFTKEEFDLEEVKEMLIEKYNLKVSYERKQTLKGFINNVMIDCIRFDYPHLYEPDVIEDIRLESIPDIIAMKLSAIAQNGTRIKDFIDIATLSVWYSFNDMLDFYTKKFPNANVIMPIKAINYFDEIDFNESVVMLNGTFNWKKIEKRLKDMANNPNIKFNTRP
ncbi:MAG: nucleotidyl transferase AbiEii/AbiGii toxin family protein [Bacteroidaceae bacterium]|nr:nucleotidyl transferase AbiEii/AbiGii toxin family protein [Bacteroidaceae bacterium]